jgi:hypothetical protein
VFGLELEADEADEHKATGGYPPNSMSTVSCR